MQKKMRREAACSADVVFMPALTPFEAAVIPAWEKETYGVLRMIRYACEADAPDSPQRAKIWVR